jgi:hypothetical protein
MDLYVKIKRKLPFNHEQHEAMEQWYEDAKRSIGAYFKGGGSVAVGTGLNNFEELLLMPMILMIPSTDPHFMIKVHEFFLEIDTEIPQTGKTLNIGLRDNNLPLSEDNLPLNVEDYVRYRHAIKYPTLRLSEAEAKSNPLAEYYIENPEAQLQNDIDKQNNVDRAYAFYLAIKDKPEKIDIMLTVLGKNIDKIKNKHTELSKFATEKPLEFIKAYEDKNAQIRYEILRLVEKGLLKRINQGFVLSETGQELAFTMDEMIMWIKDKKNTKDVNILRGQLRQLNEHTLNEHTRDAYSSDGGFSGTEQQSEENNQAPAN